MQVGSAELSKSAATYAACLAFAATFLLTTLWGAGTATALTRGVVVAVLVRILGPLLLRPLLSTIVDAMARDRLARKVAEDESS